MSRMLTSLFLILVTSQAHASGKTKEDCFHYNEKSGKCVNKKGEEGLNKVDHEKLFKNFNDKDNTYGSADAECVDFRKFVFAEAMGGHASRKLVGWNFKGANLEGAKLHFAYIENADFRGANLKVAAWGYASFNGRIDANTVLPDDCEAKDNKIDCRR